MPDIATSKDVNAMCGAPLVELFVSPPAPPVPTPAPCKAGSSEVDKGKGSSKVKTGGAKICLDQKGIFKKETPPHPAGKPPSQKSPVSMADEGGCSAIKVPLTFVKMEGKNVVHVGTPLGMDEGAASPGTAGAVQGGCGKLSLGTPSPGGGGGGGGAPFVHSVDDPVADSSELSKESPTLTRQIQELEADGWDITYGVPKEGSYCDRANKVIVIDPRHAQTKEQLTGVLAHEVGHAKNPMPEINYPGISLQDYEDLNLNQSLKDEGNAILNEIQVQDEILVNHGVEIPISPGRETNDFLDINAKPWSQDAKADAMGQKVANWSTSTPGNPSYENYYSDFYHNKGVSLGLK